MPVALVLIVSATNQFRVQLLLQNRPGGERSTMRKKKEEGLVPAVLAKLVKGWSTYCVGQEENVSYILDMLRRTVDKVYDVVSELVVTPFPRRPEIQDQEIWVLRVGHDCYDGPE